MPIGTSNSMLIGLLTAGLVGLSTAQSPSNLEELLQDRGRTLSETVLPSNTEPRDYNPKAKRHLDRGTELFWKTRQYSKALREIETALAIDPRSPSAYGILFVYYKVVRNDARTAVFWLDRGAKHCPYSGSIQLQLGQSLVATGSHRVALERYADALRLGVEAPAEVYYSMGNARNEMRDTESAIRDWLRAVEIDKLHHSARHNLIVAYANAGRRGLAKAQAELLRDLDPTGREGAWARAALERLQ